MRITKIVSLADVKDAGKLMRPALQVLWDLFFLDISNTKQGQKKLNVLVRIMREFPTEVKYSGFFIHGPPTNDRSFVRPAVLAMIVDRSCSWSGSSVGTHLASLHSYLQSDDVERLADEAATSNDYHSMWRQILLDWLADEVGGGDTGEEWVTLLVEQIKEKREQRSKGVA